MVKHVFQVQLIKDAKASLLDLLTGKNKKLGLVKPRTKPKIKENETRKKIVDVGSVILGTTFDIKKLIRFRITNYSFLILNQVKVI